MLVWLEVKLSHSTLSKARLCRDTRSGPILTWMRWNVKYRSSFPTALGGSGEREPASHFKLMREAGQPKSLTLEIDLFPRGFKHVKV